MQQHKQVDYTCKGEWELETSKESYTHQYQIKPSQKFPDWILYPPYKYLQNNHENYPTNNLRRIKSCIIKRTKNTIRSNECAQKSMSSNITVKDLCKIAMEFCCI